MLHPTGLRTLLLSLVIACAALAAPAASLADEGERWLPGQEETERARQVAIAHWGRAPCSGTVQITWEPQNPLINARARWSNPVGAYDAPELNVDCLIVFNPDQLWTWPKFCTVMVHEFGHLAGHPHAEDGPDVMSPIYRAPLPACRHPAPAFVAPPPPAAAAAGAGAQQAKRSVRSCRRFKRGTRRHRSCLRRQRAQAPPAVRRLQPS